MAAYQEGGLAAVGMPVQPEEEEAITTEQIVERTTNPAAGQSLTQMIMENKQSALDRLRATRESLAQRRTDQMARMDQDRWLALAQAMLTPTRTGAFGENIGMAASALREENTRRAAAESLFDEQEYELTSAEIAAESEMIDQLLKQTGYGNQAKSLHGAIQTMVAPEDVNKPIAQQRIIFGVVKEDQSGAPQMEALKDPSGAYFIAADRLEPARVAALTEAADRTASQVSRSEDMISNAYGAKSPLTNIRRANELLENAETIIETSGVNVLKNRLANFLGIDFGDTVELTELQMLVAEDYITKLTNLKGSSSDRDVMEMKGISVGLGQNVTANYRRLKQMEAIYSTQVRRGIRESWQSGDKDAVADLWEAAEGNVWVPGAIPVQGPITREKYDELAPGTAFFEAGDWGGRVYTKPRE
jgi:hypothetical protein